MIWTTTTWTIPGNLAICLNPGYDYSLVKASNGECYIMAKELAKGVLNKAGLEISETLAEFKGADLELLTARHPLFDQDSLVICGDHVTLDAGTGCVHTAPAYGADDFFVCQKYPQIKAGKDLVVNVDDRGCFTADAGKYEGLNVQQAHEPIFADLKAGKTVQQPIGREKMIKALEHSFYRIRVVKHNAECRKRQRIRICDLINMKCRLTGLCQQFR